MPSTVVYPGHKKINTGWPSMTSSDQVKRMLRDGWWQVTVRAESIVRYFVFDSATVNIINIQERRFKHKKYLTYALLLVYARLAGIQIHLIFFYSHSSSPMPSTVVYPGHKKLTPGEHQWRHQIRSNQCWETDSDKSQSVQTDCLEIFGNYAEHNIL